MKADNPLLVTESVTIVLPGYFLQKAAALAPEGFVSIQLGAALARFSWRRPLQKIAQMHLS